MQNIDSQSSLYFFGQNMIKIFNLIGLCKICSLVGIYVFVNKAEISLYFTNKFGSILIKKFCTFSVGYLSIPMKIRYNCKLKKFLS